MTYLRSMKFFPIIFLRDLEKDKIEKQGKKLKDHKKNYIVVVPFLTVYRFPVLFLVFIIYFHALSYLIKYWFKIDRKKLV